MTNINWFHLGSFIFGMICGAASVGIGIIFGLWISSILRER